MRSAPSGISRQRRSKRRGADVLVHGAAGRAIRLGLALLCLHWIPCSMPTTADEVDAHWRAAQHRQWRHPSTSKTQKVGHGLIGLQGAITMISRPAREGVTLATVSTAKQLASTNMALLTAWHGPVSLALHLEEKWIDWFYWKVSRDPLVFKRTEVHLVISSTGDTHNRTEILPILWNLAVDAAHTDYVMPTPLSPNSHLPADLYERVSNAVHFTAIGNLLSHARAVLAVSERDERFLVISMRRGLLPRFEHDDRGHPFFRWTEALLSAGFRILRPEDCGLPVIDAGNASFPAAGIHADAISEPELEHEASFLREEVEAEAVPCSAFDARGRLRWMAASMWWTEPSAARTEALWIEPRLWVYSNFVQPVIRAARTDISLVTQISLNRVGRLALLASSWGGPLSVAVFVGSEEVSALGEALRQSASQLGRVSVHLLIHAKEYAAQYPINLLRNLALEAAETELVMMLDADFIPSPRTRAELVALSGRGAWRARLFEERGALVVPAFEMGSQGRADAAAFARLPLKRSELGRMLHRGEAAPFHLASFWPAHASTDFPRYYATPSGSQPYRTRYRSLWFEPYVLMARRGASWGLPRFWDFRGWGWNKASWFVELNASGSEFFVVSGEAFLVHMDHPAPRLAQDKALSPDTQAKMAQFQDYLRARYGVDANLFKADFQVD